MYIYIYIIVYIYIYIYIHIRLVKLGAAAPSRAKSESPVNQTLVNLPHFIIGKCAVFHHVAYVIEFPSGARFRNRPPYHAFGGAPVREC